MLLRNGGVGLRRRRFRDNDNNVYVFEDRAFYCPDASHPIMSVGDWRRRGATTVFGTGEHITHTRSGKALPKGLSTFIVDKQGRVLTAQPIDDMPNLSWLIPIQPTSMADIEGTPDVHEQNKKMAASILDEAFEKYEAVAEANECPTVDDYTTKVQKLQQELEELHLMHSQLYGAAHEDSTKLITAAHELMTDLAQGSPDDYTGCTVTHAPMRNC